MTAGVRDAQQALGVFRDERAHLVHLVDAVQAIALVDDEEHLLAPFSDVLEKPHLRLRHRAVGGEHEQHQIRARHELLRQTLLPLENDVRPGGVHDVHLAKEIRGDVLGVESVRRLLRARRASPCRSTEISFVVGRIPSFRCFSPSTALITLDLPALNSPTITSKKSSSRPFRASTRRSISSSAGAAAARNALASSKSARSRSSNASEGPSIRRPASDRPGRPGRPGRPAAASPVTARFPAAFSGSPASASGSSLDPPTSPSASATAAAEIAAATSGEVGGSANANPCARATTSATASSFASASQGDWREHGRRDDAARLLRRLRGRRDDEIGTLLRGDDDSRRVSRRARHDRGSRE